MSAPFPTTSPVANSSSDNNNFLALFHVISAQGERLELLRKEIMDRLDKAAEDTGRLRGDLPREYVPRIEHMGRWAEQDKVITNLTADIIELKDAIKDLTNRLDAQIEAAHARAITQYFQVIMALLGPLLGALMTIMFLHR